MRQWDVRRRSLWLRWIFGIGLLAAMFVGLLALIESGVPSLLFTVPIGLGFALVQRADWPITRAVALLMSIIALPLVFFFGLGLPVLLVAQDAVSRRQQYRLGVTSTVPVTYFKWRFTVIGILWGGLGLVVLILMWSDVRLNAWVWLSSFATFGLIPGFAGVGQLFNPLLMVGPKGFAWRGRVYPTEGIEDVQLGNTLLLVKVKGRRRMIRIGSSVLNPSDLVEAARAINGLRTSATAEVFS